MPLAFGSCRHFRYLSDRSCRVTLRS